MNKLLPFVPLMAAAVLSCTHDELISAADTTSEPLAAATSAPSAYETFLVQIPGADLYNLGTLTSKGVVTAFAQGNTGGQTYVRWEDGVTSTVGQMPPSGFQITTSPNGLVGGAFWACPPGSACDEVRAFYLWRDGAVIQEIPVPPPGRNVTMHHLHDDGSFLAIFEDLPYLYENGAFHLLPGLGTGFYQAIGRNEKGQIFGTSRAPGYRFFRAVLWENRVPAALPDLESTPCTDDPQQICTLSFANAINKHGDVVGYVSNGETGEYRSVVWRYGQAPVHIDVLPGEFSMGSKINDHGQVVVSGFSRHFLWDNGTAQPVGTLGGGGSTTVGDLNERGEVVGSSSHPDGFHHAYIWRAGQMSDLGVGPDAVTSFASRINDKGEIAGLSTSGDFQRQRVVVWRPAGNNLVATVGP